MALSIASLRRKNVVRPPLMVLYGTKGVGKTTFAAGAPSPVLLSVEDGKGMLDVPDWPIPSYADLMQAIGELLSAEHDFQTLILDSLDWLEPIIWAETALRNNWRSIESPDFGKGYLAADEVWREVIDGMKAIRDERNMGVIMIAHEEVKRFESPEVDPYERYQLKLHKRASALMQEHADVVAFMSYDAFVTEKDVGFNKKVARAIGSGTRLLRLEERPAFQAKNRLGLPAEIRLPTQAGAHENPQAIWQAFADHLPK